ncbi:MAG: hypothetical protein ACPGXX_13355 [Planctomycetaceae bacterium]
MFSLFRAARATLLQFLPENPAIRLIHNQRPDGNIPQPAGRPETRLNSPGPPPPYEQATLFCKLQIATTVIAW